ncbi:MAG: hypothetical protein QM479_09835 [Pseudomonadota bacterium]
MNQFKSGYSFNTLVQLFVFTIVIAVLILLSLPFLKSFYFANQITYTGILINGLIVSLFFIGLLKIIYLLFYYWAEEKALAQLVRNLNQAQHNITLKVCPKSIIAGRFQTMTDIHKKKSNINQSALASILVAHESTLLSLPRFISNILILCGVFGTIISLSIALLGASNLLETSHDISGMGTVIHGMSTALSTTTTAIVCYLFFGYFFQRLSDIQTHLFSAIELVTTQHLMPKFNHQGDNIMFQLTELVSSLNQTAISMQSVQQQLLSASQKADNLISKYDSRMNNMESDMHIIADLLRQGFRLPNKPNEITRQTQAMPVTKASHSQPIKTNTSHPLGTQNVKSSAHSPVLKHGRIEHSNTQNLIKN